QAEDGIRDRNVTGVQTCALPISCRTVVRTRAPGFGLRQAWEVVHLNIFGDIASCGAASAPMQSYALYRCGLPVGAGLGLMTLRRSEERRGGEGGKAEWGQKQ